MIKLVSIMSSCVRGRDSLHELKEPILMWPISLIVKGRIELVSVRDKLYFNWIIRVSEIGKEKFHLNTNKMSCEQNLFYDIMYYRIVLSQMDTLQKKFNYSGTTSLVIFCYIELAYPTYKSTQCSICLGK